MSVASLERLAEAPDHVIVSQPAKRTDPLWLCRVAIEQSRKTTSEGARRLHLEVAEGALKDARDELARLEAELSAEMASEAIDGAEIPREQGGPRGKRGGDRRSDAARNQSGESPTLIKSRDVAVREPAQLALGVVR